MKSLQSRKWVDPLGLFLLAVLAYGLMIPRLGLFGDDWPHLWVLHTFGLDGLNQLVAWDRPYSSWVYALIAPLAGENLWIYHTYLLILRWICSFIFYLLLVEIFPDSKPLPFWAAAFFLLYPGFRQEPQPLEFILHFTALGLMLASFWLMIKASQRSLRPWLFQAVGIATALSIFSVEYFIGLELLRPVFLWILLRKTSSSLKTTLRKVLVNWFPYLLVLGLYAYWRVIVFKFPTYKPTFLGQVTNHPWEAIAGMGQTLVEEIRASVLGAWRQMISLPADQPLHWGYVALVCLTFIGVFLWLRSNKENAEKASPWLPFLVGGISIFLAGIPFWITGIPVQLEFPWDRSTLPFMIGASLLMAGGLLLFRPRWRNSLAAGLIALSIGMHFQNTLLYQKEWAKLSQFFWQLSWRAPSLKSGTVVISDAIPLFYYGDNNLTPVLNWTYNPDGTSIDLAYNFFDMGERLGKNLPELKPDLPISHGYRFVNFNSTSSMLLPVFYKDGQCLRTIDERTIRIASVPRRLRETASFSKPEELIGTSGLAVPPTFIPEPEHGWCYYYQKAELSAQTKDWQKVSGLFQETITKNLHPLDQTEWLPFIEGLARSGNLADAVEITTKGFMQEGAKPVLCGLWSVLSSDPEIQNSLQAGNFQTGCE